MTKIIVASKNQVKIDAASAGYKMMFPADPFEIAGVSVPSGVADQPMGDEETWLGARNRCDNAAKEAPNADYWVGIETGIEEIKGSLWVFSWMVVKSKENKYGAGRSASFAMPEKIATLVRQGTDMGKADDTVFQRENSGQQNGTVGILTGNAITRATFQAPAVAFAFIPFKNPELY